jgi:DNA-binding response OmpR family regulator
MEFIIDCRRQSSFAEGGAILGFDMSLSVPHTHHHRRILLLEDNAATVKAIRTHLEREVFVVDAAGSLGDARALIGDHSYAAIIIDRRLDDGDGLVLLAGLPANVTRPPALVLSARGTLADRLEGLRAGADDYLPKPFAMAELVERLNALLRRPPNLAARSITLGDLVLDPAGRQLTISGKPVSTTRRELSILLLLMRRPGAVVLHEDLIENVYGIDTQIESNAIEAHVSRLRTRLRDHGSTVTIRRVRGVGYLVAAGNVALPRA